MYIPNRYSIILYDTTCAHKRIRNARGSYTTVYGDILLLRVVVVLSARRQSPSGGGAHVL